MNKIKNKISLSVAEIDNLEKQIDVFLENQKELLKIYLQQREEIDKYNSVNHTSLANTGITTNTTISQDEIIRIRQENSKEINSNTTKGVDSDYSNYICIVKRSEDGTLKIENIDKKDFEEESSIQLLDWNSILPENPTVKDLDTIMENAKKQLKSSMEGIKKELESKNKEKQDKIVEESNNDVVINDADEFDIEDIEDDNVIIDIDDEFAINPFPSDEKIDSTDSTMEQANDNPQKISDELSEKFHKTIKSEPEAEEIGAASENDLSSLLNELTEENKENEKENGEDIDIAVENKNESIILNPESKRFEHIAAEDDNSTPLDHQEIIKNSTQDPLVEDIKPETEEIKENIVTDLQEEQKIEDAILATPKTIAVNPNMN